MKFKKLLRWMTAAVILTVGTSSFVLAQQGERRQRMSPEAMAKRTVERLHARLNLNDAQKDSIYAYQLEQSKQRRTSFENAGQDRSAMRETMMELRQATTSKIISVLNDEQQAEYRKMLEERPNRSEAQGRGGRRGPR